MKPDGPLLLRRSRVPSWAEIVSTDGWIRLGVLALLVVATYAAEINRLRHDWEKLSPEEKKLVEPPPASK